jgi:hypothetical protein
VGDFGSHGPDHSGDMQGARPSMSSEMRLDYAIGRPHAKTVINPVMAKFREGTSR